MGKQSFKSNLEDLNSKWFYACRRVLRSLSCNTLAVRKWKPAFSSSGSVESHQESSSPQLTQNSTKMKSWTLPTVDQTLLLSIGMKMSNTCSKRFGQCISYCYMYLVISQNWKEETLSYRAQIQRNIIQRREKSKWTHNVYLAAR